jgi:hypothetical protein
MVELETLQAVKPEVRMLDVRMVALTAELQRYTRGVHDRLKYKITRAADVNGDYTIGAEPAETVRLLRSLKP